MILLIDNYDSFTHNLYQYLQELTEEEIRVVRNDAISPEQVGALSPSRIIISPGPGRPEGAGISVEVIRRYGASTPILGVCLGHQAIAAAYGAEIVQAKRIVHGKAEEVDLDGHGLFRSIGTPASFTRYHSLAVDEDTLPPELTVTARAYDGEIMGLRHAEYLVEGVQFHPESVASDAGKKLLRNFLHYRREPFRPKAALTKLLDGTPMTREEAESFMEELTEGNLTPAQIGGFLVAMNAAGITPEEIAGCAAVLQRKRVAITAEVPLLDTCGTGGDGLGTFNISSLSAIVASAAGAAVAKHGNKAVSSRSGSADFYSALGIDIKVSPDEAERVLRDTGFAFLFAPLYHGAMRHAAVPRRELGVKTIMNLLGPLANPAGAAYQIIGVYDEALAETVARAAHLLGVKRVMVVHGQDGLDELSVAAPSTVITVDEEGNLERSTVHPEDFGMTGYATADLEGGDGEANAAVAREILAGGGPPAIRDAVILNAAAALVVAGVAEDLRDGVSRAREALTGGRALEQIERVVAATSGREQAVGEGAGAKRDRAKSAAEVA